MIKVLYEPTKEQYENMLNKVIDYILDFEKEYNQKKEHTEFEEGQWLAYYTILDTIKNQIIVDNVAIDKDLEKLSDSLLEKILPQK